MSVYLAGYVLEGYLKILYLIGAEGEEDLYTHECRGLLDDIKKIRSLFPGTIEIDTYLELEDKIKRLLKGTQAYPAWHPKKRYEISTWDSRSHSEKIQGEIEKIMDKIQDLKLSIGGTN